MSRKNGKKKQPEFKLQCRIEPDLKDKFRTAAKRDGRDESSLLRKLVIDHVSK